MDRRMEGEEEGGVFVSPWFLLLFSFFTSLMQCNAKEEMGDGVLSFLSNVHGVMVMDC